MSVDWRLERREIERKGTTEKGKIEDSMRGNGIIAPGMDEFPDNERCPIAA